MKFLADYGKRVWRLDVEEKLSKATQQLHSSVQEAETSKSTSYIQKNMTDASSPNAKNLVSPSNSNTKRSAIHRAIISESGEKNEDLWQPMFEPEVVEIPGIPKRYKYGISSPKNVMKPVVHEVKELGKEESSPKSPKSPKDKKVRTMKSIKEENSPASTKNPGHKKGLSDGNISPFTPLTISKLNNAKNKSKPKKEAKRPEKIKIQGTSEGLKSPLSPKFSSSIFLDKLFPQGKTETLESAPESADVRIKLKTSQIRINLEPTPKNGMYIDTSPLVRSMAATPRAKNFSIMTPKTTSMNEVAMQLTKHWESKYSPRVFNWDMIHANTFESERDITTETKPSMSTYYMNNEASMPTSPSNYGNQIKLKPIHAGKTANGWMKQKKPLQMSEFPEPKIKKNYSLGVIIRGDPFTPISKEH